MSRARRIQQFLSQNTYMAKKFTGVEGSTVPLKETIESFDAIAKGDFDHVAEQAFFNVGGIDDVEEQVGADPEGERLIMAELKVSVVSADHEVWSGEATHGRRQAPIEGEIGILAGHEPVLAILAAGEVRVTGLRRHEDRRQRRGRLPLGARTTP